MPVALQLADHLLDALREDPFRTQVEIADAGREQLLLADLAHDRGREQASRFATRSMPCLERRDPHADPSFTMRPRAILAKTRTKIFPPDEHKSFVILVTYETTRRVARFYAEFAGAARQNRATGSSESA